MFLRGNIYHTNFYFKGRRYRISLHTRDIHEAIARERVFRRFLEDNNVSGKEIPLWKDFKHWYFRFIEDKLKSSTQHIHKLAVSYLEEYKTPYYLRSITPEFLSAFKRFLSEKYNGKKVSARNRYFKAVKAIMHTAEKFGKIGIKQNWEIISADRENDSRIEYHSVFELQQIKEVLDGDLLTVFYLGWEEGLRRGEIAFLYKTDYNPYNHTITIRAKPEWQPKTKKSARTIPLCPVSEAAIQQSIARSPQSSPYIINLPGNRLYCGYLSSAYIKATRERVPHLHCYLHKLRHTFGSLLIQQGVHIKTVSDLMGHSNILQTEKYVHLGPSQYVDAINCLPKI